MKALLYQQVYIERADQGRLFAVSHALARKHNPDADFLIIDNASPMEPWQFVNGLNWDKWCLEDASYLVTIEGDTWVRFPDAIGHPYKGGTRDGAGRANMYAIEQARDNEYDCLLHVEADALAVKPIPDTATLACLPDSQYGWPDFTAFSIGLEWAERVRFVERYGWDQARDWSTFVSEQAMADIAGEELERINWRCLRAENRPLNAYDYAGLDCLTHAGSLDLATFLELHGEHRLAARL